MREEFLSGQKHPLKFYGSRAEPTSMEERKTAFFPYIVMLLMNIKRRTS